MELLSFFRDLLVPKLILKIQMFAFVVFVGAVFGIMPSWQGILGYLLFFVTYLSTYFYNDLIDLEDDRRKAVYPAKLLARGKLNEEEAFFLSVNLFALGVLACFLYDPLLGVVAFFAVFLNNLRSHVSDLLLRQILLIFVEFLNFVAAWISIFNSVPSLLPSAVFLEYTTLYALGHVFYKVRSGSIRRVILRKDVVFLTLVAVVLILPTLCALSIHPLGLLFGIGGALFYILPQYLRAKKADLNEQEFIDRIYWQHTFIMGVVGLWFLVGALIIMF